MANSKARSRYFATIIYPESSPENLKERINEFKVQALLSPLHDRDLKESTQEFKKPHYHLMVCFQSLKSKRQVEFLFNQVNGVGCEIVESPIYYARYLCHLDCPKKAQYNIDNVESWGIDYKRFIRQKSEADEDVANVLKYIDEKEIEDFFSLVKSVQKEKPEILSEIVKHSYFYHNFLRSRKFQD